MSSDLPESVQIVANVPRLPPRPLDSNKGTFGRVLIVSGSRGMSGAAVLCAGAALRGGAGLVRLAVPEGILPIVASANPCYTTAPLPQDAHGRLTAAALPELLELADGKLIESVLMLYPPLGDQSARATVCVSSQAGCAYGCTFCATGQMGFDRHLNAGEIVAQVLYFARELRATLWTAKGLPGSAPIDHITNIVLMGMGEPLHNYENVLQALRILNSPDGFCLGARHMTVSTVGLVPAIRRLGQEQLQVNLAISLHAPTDELRSRTMPVNRKYPIAELIAACQEYIVATHRQVTFEYVLLAGVNDTPEYAHKLGELLAPLKQFAHVNCIPVNVTAADYRPPSGEAIRAFRDILYAHNVSNSVRAERGDDIAAACGQLRTRFEKNKRQPVASQ